MTEHSVSSPPVVPPKAHNSAKRTGMARCLVWFGFLVGGAMTLVLVLGLAVIMFAYSPSGGPTLARLTAGIVNDLETGIELELGTIQLHWPLSLKVQDIRLRDGGEQHNQKNDGSDGNDADAWLQIPQLEITVRPASLIPTKGSWRIEISKAVVRQATWSRVPVLPPTTAPNTDPTEPQAITLLPDWLSVVIESLVLENAHINAAALDIAPTQPHIPASAKVQLALQGTLSAHTAQAEIHAEIRPVTPPIAVQAHSPDPTAAHDTQDTPPTGPLPVTRLLLKADWKNATLTLNSRIEDTALLAPHLPDPRLDTNLQGDIPTSQPENQPEGQPKNLANGQTDALSPRRHLAIQGDIKVHIPVLPPVAAHPLRIDWALNSTAPALPSTLFSGALSLDDAALTWEKVEIRYSPPAAAGDSKNPKDAASDSTNSLRSKGSFHFQQGPTAQLELRLQDVATLANFGLPMPIVSGPLNATLHLASPATVNLEIQSPALMLAQGALQGLALKIQARSPAVKAEGQTTAPTAPIAPITGWQVPTALNGTLELTAQSCMGFGPLKLSTTWGLENMLANLGGRIANLQADMLGVTLRGGLAYTEGSFTDAALDLAVTDTSALAKLFDIPLKGCPLTFKARVAPETKEKTIQGQLHFGAGSYDSFAWLSGEGSVLVSSIKASLNLSLTGQLSARVRCSYTFAEQILRIDTVELGDTKLKLGAKLQDPTDLRFANGISIGETNISLHPSGAIHIKGKLEAQNLSLEAKLADIPLALAKAFTTAPIPEGIVSARVGLAGSPSAPTGTVQVRVDNIPLASTVGGPKASLVVDGKLSRASTKGGGSHSLHLQSHWEGLESLSNFTATAQIPLHFAPAPSLLMNAPLRANLFWQGDIAPLWRLVPLPGRSLSGKAEVQAQVTGSLAAPILMGQAFVGQGRFVDSVDGLLLDNISIEARYDPQKQSILRLKATDGRGGTVNLDGSLSAGNSPKGTKAAKATGGTRLDLHGIINKLRPLRRDDVAVQLSGTVDITGPLTAPLVAANLCVDQGLVQLLDGFGGGTSKNLTVEERKATTTASPAPNAAKAGVAQAPTPSTPSDPALVPRCDIRITAPNRLYIRGKGLDSEWKVNLRMSGPLADPQIVGNVIPIRGNLELLGHQFTLASGDIAFTGSLPPNPALDLSLQYKSTDITALIIFSGSAKQPKMRLSSQPVLPNDEIIAQILFGKKMSSLSRFEALQAANTARQLVDLGPSSLDIMSTARDLLGLQVLRLGSTEASRKSQAPRDASLQGTSNANSDDQAPTIEAGKYILDNVYVGLEQGTDAKTGTTVRVEVELMPNLSLEGKTSNESTGLGINWKRDY